MKSTRKINLSGYLEMKEIGPLNTSEQIKDL